MSNRNLRSTVGPPGYDFSHFGVSVVSDDGTLLVVEVRGELDVATGPVLHEHLEPYKALPKSDGHLRRIVYDLSDLRFMDATGLRALLTAIDGHGPNTIAVRQPSRQVRRILELVGLDSMIENPNDEGAR